MTYGLAYLAVTTTVSGGINLFGFQLGVAVVIAFLLGCFVGHKWL